MSFRQAFSATPWPGFRTLTSTAEGAIPARGRTDPSGTGLDDVRVTFYQYTDSYWDYIGSVSTDINGDYEQGGLTTGTYRVSFYDYNDVYAPEWNDDAEDLDTATNVSVTLGQETSGIDAQLGTFSNYTITTTADPTEGGSVSCDPNPVDHGSDSTCRPTASDGYSFDAWSGDCSGASCTLSDVTSDKTVTANFAIDTGEITGVITDEKTGLPLQEATVALFEWNAANGWWRQIEQLSVDGDGAFTVSALEAGTYYLQLDTTTDRYLSEYYDDTRDWQQKTQLVVAPGDQVTLEPIDLMLRPGTSPFALTLDIPATVPDGHCYAFDLTLGTSTLQPMVNGRFGEVCKGMERAVRLDASDDTALGSTGPCERRASQET